MKVLMEPHLSQLEGESGIVSVVRKYFKYLPEFGVELVAPTANNFDLIAQHAGGLYNYQGNVPICAHLHGLHWQRSEPLPDWEMQTNSQVIHSIRMAQQVTVPSAFVAGPLQRDMHINPHIVPHGIDLAEWQHAEPNEGYVLWAKNRTSDVCNPDAVGELAKWLPSVTYVTTFAPKQMAENIKVIGVQPHEIMKRIMQCAAVYLSSTQETFGLATLEAMACGVPIVGFDNGGNRQLVQHGVNGYLARPGDFTDLANGLRYCLQHRDVLGQNGKLLAKNYTWLTVAEQVARVYESVAVSGLDMGCAVIIPCYNLAHHLERAVKSVLAQTQPASEIIIVNNNSTDDTEKVAKRLMKLDKRIQYINCPEQGVAHARNAGIQIVRSGYICCLDSDDELAPSFLDVCLSRIQSDSTIGVSYAKLRWIDDNAGTSGISEWPGEYNFDAFLAGQNQVPTACIFRRDLWARLGGYRQRYAPQGQGAEDAEFWLRLGQIGFKGVLATEEPLFLYHLGGRTQTESYTEVDWLQWHKTQRTPFASLATPKQFSHPVFQYDEPSISVIIPVGPNHAKHLVDALDSLEAQSFSNWEAIVVFDDGEPVNQTFLDAYPFIVPVYTKRVGAGAARNAGAKLARSLLLLFLDADDWLIPTALEKMHNQYLMSGDIVYSDYTGHSQINDPKEAQKLDDAGRLLHYDHQQAVIAFQAANYDCELAIRQPELVNGQYYLWCLVSSLLPRAWHEEIGGFDETMASWEDWDYWLRLARAGKCFTRIAERLVHYRFSTGSRREIGGQNYDSLIQYLQEKYKGTKAMCNNCRGNSQPSNLLLPQQAQQQTQMNPNDVMVRLNDGNKGDHSVVGFVTRRHYGYHAHGEEFLMDKRDVDAVPHKLILLAHPMSSQETGMPVVPIDPKPIPVESFDFSKIDGFTPEIIEKVHAMGIHTKDGFINVPHLMLRELFSAKALTKILKALE